jgi:SH3-like domain-containing protein
VLALLPASHQSVNSVNTADKSQAVAQSAAAGPGPADLPASAEGGKTGVTTIAAVASPAPADQNAGPSGTANNLPSTADLSAQIPPAEPKLPDGLSDGKIGASAVNVRSGPSSDSDKRFVIQPGEPVKIGEANGNWVHVYRGDGTDGWVYGRYIAGHEPPPDSTPTATAPRRSAVADEPQGAGNLIGRFGEAHGLITARVGPNGAAPPAFLLQPGDRFRISQARGAWILIVTEDGMSGWIAS